MTFCDAQAFERREVYTHYSQVYLMITYAFVWCVRLIFGIDLSIAQNYVVLFYILILSAITFFYSRQFLLSQQVLDFRQLVIIFISLGIVITNSSLWLSMVIFSRDNYHPFASLSFMLLSAQYYRGKFLDTLSFFALIAIALLAPLYIFIALIILIFLYDKSSEPSLKRSTFYRKLFVIGILGTISLFLPKLFFYLMNFSRGGSSMFYRTGLNGRMDYFKNALVSTIWPFNPKERPWCLFHFPVITGIYLTGIAWFIRDRALISKMLRQWLIALTPYLFLVVFFPQYVSIHPYYGVDTHLTMACSFSIFLWSLEPKVLNKISGSGIIIWFFVISGTVMNNLIEISRIRYLH